MKIINEFLAGETKLDGVVVGELLVVLVMVLYLPITSFHYIYYDDPSWIFGNPMVLSGLSWKSLHWVITGVVSGNWCPLTNLSFLLEYQVFGARPVISHLISFLLHLANVLLLFRFVLLLLGRDWRAALVALLFAIHPMNVQAVAWVSERKGVLSAFFLLLMLSSWLKYAKVPTLRRYCLTFILYALSLASKPTVVTVPLALLLLDIWPLARINGGNLKHVILEKIPFLMLAVGNWALLYIWLGGSIIPPYSITTNVQTAIVGLARYVANLVCPIDLNICYFHPAFFQLVAWPKSLVVTSACLLLAISLISCFMWRREKGFIVCWAIFLILIAPVIQFVPAGHSYMGDRFAYVPYIWLFIMIANALELLIRGRASRVTITAAAILAVGLLTCVAVRQLATWKNTVTVFNRALAIDPDNPIAHSNLAVGYSLDKNHRQAIEHIRAALKLAPDNDLTWRMAAETYARAGLPLQAVQCYRSALDVCQSPDNMTALARLLSTNTEVRNPAEALKLARQVLAIDPSAANLDLFAAALAASGNFEDAIRIESRAVSEDSLPAYREHLSTFQNHEAISEK